MSNIRSVFRSARFLGDTSSLAKGFQATGGRVVTRVAGRQFGRGIIGMSVTNMFIWAQFFDWVRHSIRENAAKDQYVVSFMAYARGYDEGFRQPAGRKLPPPGYQFFQKGVFDGALTQSGKGAYGRPGGIRSGLYIGGRFAADITAIANGSIAQRIGRRTVGRSMTRLFWGTLKNPDYNYLEGIAKNMQQAIRFHLMKDGLYDTGALHDSIQYGGSVEEAAAKSRAMGIRALIRNQDRFAGDMDAVIKSKVIGA